MSPDELRVRVRRIPEELITQGELTVADELVAPGCRHHAPELMSPGADGLKHWVIALRRSFPDLCAIVEDEITEGDTAMQRLTLSGTHDATLGNAPAAGRRATWQHVAIFRLGGDGTIAEHWSSWDRLDLLRQLVIAPIAGDAQIGHLPISTADST